MITLEEIKEFAIKKEACSGEINPFINYINNGDEKSAWQTVLGNMNWLNKMGLDFETDISTIFELADNIGKNHFQLTGTIYNIYKYDKNGSIIYIESYFNNGNLHYIANYKNDEYNGLYTEYNYNGIKIKETNYLNDIENGIRTYYDANGVITERYKYVDGERICELLR